MLRISSVSQLHDPPKQMVLWALARHREGFLCVPLSSPLCLRLHAWLCCSPSALWFCDDLLGSPSSSFVLVLTAGDTQATVSCCT